MGDSIYLWINYICVQKRKKVLVKVDTAIINAV